MRVVYGVNPVRELFRAGAEGVSELWLAEGAQRSKALDELERLARHTRAKVRRAPRQKLDQLAGAPHHQGVVAVVPDFAYSEVEDLIESAGARGEPPLLVVLDGIEDPHNLGAIIRSAHALGAHGVVIPRDRAVGITPAAAKASAGAVEHTRVARVTNLAQTLERLKELGIWSVGTAPDAAQDLADIDMRGPTALVIGGEGEGLRPLVRRTCDHVARIPMAGEFDSLNASASAAVALYEAARQRRARSPAGGGTGR